MNKNFSNKYFVILNKNEIIFSCLNKENKISYTKKQILTNGLNNIIKELENFFTDNLIEIERNLKDFIKKIYIIFDIDEVLSVDLSIKYKFESGKINEKKNKRPIEPSKVSVYKIQQQSKCNSHDN